MILAMIAMAGSVFLSLLFLSAAAHKFADLTRFAAVLEVQNIVPAWGLKAARYLIPLVELGVGLSLLAAAMRPLAAIVSAGVLAVYGLGMAVNLHRGRTALDCGCSLLIERPLSTALLWRNGGLILLAMMVALAPLDTPLGLVAIGNAAGAGVVWFLIYVALEALAATGGQMAKMESR